MPPIWDKFNPEVYVKANYFQLHDEDVRIIRHLVQFYQTIPKLNHAIEIGTGPNLYPVMAMLPNIDQITCLEYSKANIFYLEKQLENLDQHWYQFWRLLHQLNHSYSTNLLADLKQRIVIKQGSIYKLEAGQYDLASMFFCAESITNSRKNFNQVCHQFTHSVKTKGYLVAAFMENSSSYEVDGTLFPSFSVNKNIIQNVFSPITSNLKIHHIPLSNLPLRPGYTGMLLLTANRN